MKVQDIFIDSAMKSDKAFQAVSLFDSVEDTKKKIDTLAEGSIPVTINDRYGNELSATGTPNDRVQSFTNYGYSNDTLNWTLWLSLYNDSWVFRRAIDKPSQDVVNCGFSINGNEDYSLVYKQFERHKSKLIELVMWGSLFGGSVAVMLFDGISDEEMSHPLKKSQIVGKTMRLYVTDRWYGVGENNTQTVTSMKDIDFGTPISYNITFADGHSCTVHHSFILRYEHRIAPRLIKNGQLQGWGYAEGAHILNELSRDDQLKSAITSLVNKSLIEVIKMKGMKGVFMGADKGNEDQLRMRLEMVNWGRTFNSLTFLDTEDDYQQHNFSGVTGLADLMEKNMRLIAAALEMQGVLYGDLDGGFSADTVAMQRYAIVIKNRADTYFRPVLYKFLKIVFIQAGLDDKKISFEFNSINQAQESKEKSDAINAYTRSLVDLVNNGIISKYQMALSMREYINKNQVSIQFDEERLNLLKYEEEMNILKGYKSLGKTKSDSVIPTEGGSGFGESPMSGEMSSPEAGFGEEDFGNDEIASAEPNLPEAPEQSNDFGGFEEPTE